MSVATPHTVARGVVLIHAASAAACPHIRWALDGALGVEVRLHWTRQPAAPGLMRCEFTWQGAPGTGSLLASTLRGFDRIRFEVTEEPSPGVDGSRWMHTPSLGIHHTRTSANGDAVINEDRIREVVRLAQGSPEAMGEMVEELLGADWDNELEPFRYAGDGAPVRWLHKVG